MSLITSCPACATMFRVVPDQLKISEGWVRCGHCHEVFDATANLAEEAAAVFADHPDPPADPHPVGPPAMPSPLATRPAPVGRLSTSAPMPLPAEPPADSGPDSESESDLDAPFVFRRSDLVDPEAVPSVLPPVPSRQDGRFRAEEEVQAPELDDVSFVRQARRKAWWRRPAVRLLLAFTSLLLAAALLLQVAYDDRDRVAMLQPRLRPALELMCEQLLCTLGPPRQIEAVAIESSGFNRLRNDTYRLSFTLRNTAPLTVAAPAMELTLTDSQDQPVLRRVLTPAELGARDNVIAAGAEWSGTIGLALNNGNGRIAGYRLLAFYP